MMEVETIYYTGFEHISGYRFPEPTFPHPHNNAFAFDLQRNGVYAGPFLLSSIRFLALISACLLSPPSIL